MEQGQHIILRATVEAEFEAGNEVSQRVADLKDWCVKELFEDLDDILCQQDVNEQLIQINKMHLSLQLDAYWNPKSPQFKTSIRKQMREQLISILEKQQIKIPLTYFRANLLLEYFRTGVLPNKLSGEDKAKGLKSLIRQVSESDDFRNKLYEVFRSRDAYKRFYILGGEEFTLEFINRFSFEKTDWKQKANLLYKFLNNADYLSSLDKIGLYQELTGPILKKANLQQISREILLSRLIFSKAPTEISAIRKSAWPDLDEAMQEILVKKARQGVEKDESEDQIFEANREDIDNDLNSPDSIFVSNAGLVLIASYIPGFFRNLGYFEKGNPLKSVKSLPILLHSLATGESQAEEWQLVLPKLLCGLEPGENCVVSKTLSKKETREMEALFHAVIQHWDKLKNTSSEGLRDSFLRREGYLSYKNNQWTLKVDERAIDILLRFIPWTFQWIRLPWMDKILFVEW